MTQVELKIAEYEKHKFRDQIKMILEEEITEKKQEKTLNSLAPASFTLSPINVDEMTPLEISVKSINDYINGDLYKKHTTSEFEKLVEMINNPEEQSGFNFVSFAQSLINYLLVLSQEDQPSILEGIHVLRKLLEGTLANTISEDTDSANPFRQKQKQLSKLNVFQVLTTLFENVPNDGIRLEIIQVIILLLRGPNSLSQNEFLKNLYNNRNKKFFKMIESTMERGYRTVEQSMGKINNQNLRELLRGNDTGTSVKELEIQLKVEKVDKQLEYLQCVFEMLSALCFHNWKGKKFMRASIIHETGKLDTTLTIIDFAVKLLTRTIKFMNNKSTNLANSIIEFLLNALDGPCVENQEILMGTNFFDCVKELMSYQRETMELISRCFKKEILCYTNILIRIIQVMKILLEGNRNFEAAKKRIKKAINVEDVIEIMRIKLEYYLIHKFPFKKYVNEFSAEMLSELFTINKLSYFKELGDLFDCFFVVKLVTSEYEQQKLKSRLEKNNKAVFEFFEKNTGSIEILYKKQIHTVYHSIDPIFSNFNNKTKDIIMNGVNRDAPKKKIADFVNLMPMIFDLLSFESNLFFAKIFSEKNFEGLEKITFFVTLSINLIMFLFFEKTAVNNKPVTNPSFDERHPVLLILNHLHFVLSITKLIVWILFKGRVEIMKRWREIFQCVNIKIKTLGRNSTIFGDESSKELLKKDFIKMNFKERKKLLSLYNKINGLREEMTVFDVTIHNFIFITEVFKFKYLIFYFLLSFFAYSQESNFFYSLMLLDVISFEETFQNITKSITNNIGQLSLTLILGKNKNNF